MKMLKTPEYNCAIKDPQMTHWVLKYNRMIRQKVWFFSADGNT